MNRTDIVTTLLSAFLAAAAAAQSPAPTPAPKPQADRIDELVAAVRAAEQKLGSVVIEMTTTGRLPADNTLTVRGALRVLRGKQAARHVRFEWETGDGLTGRSESAQTAGGIVLLTDDLAF